MKINRFTLISPLLCCSILSVAQIQQNIFKVSGNMLSNLTSEIDSIRFNASGTEMQVILQGFDADLHEIIEIDRVTFDTISDQLPHSCGAPKVHNPAKSYGSMTDQQGNVYKTIVIGSQEWMAENLRTSIYSNGDLIANVTDYKQWAGLTTGAWCNYNNESQYECPYGKLYNWYAAADPRNVCPSEWHVPTDAEWSVLINYLDPNADGGNLPNVAGEKLKSIGIQYWLIPNLDATNESGFSALSAGDRLSNGGYNNIGYNGFWWSSTEEGTMNAWCRYLYYYSGFANRSSFPSKGYGFSIRCLRN